MAFQSPPMLSAPLMPMFVAPRPLGASVPHRLPVHLLNAVGSALWVSPIERSAVGLVAAAGVDGAVYRNAVPAEHAVGEKKLGNAGAGRRQRWRHERWRLGHQVDIGSKRSIRSRQNSRGEDRHSHAAFPHHKFSPEKTKPRNCYRQRHLVRLSSIACVRADLASAPSAQQGKVWRDENSVTRSCRDEPRHINI